MALPDMLTRDQVEDAILLAEQRGAEKMLLALGVHAEEYGARVSDDISGMVTLARVHARRDDIIRSWEVLMERRPCLEDMDDGRCLICGGEH